MKFCEVYGNVLYDESADQCNSAISWRRNLATDTIAVVGKKRRVAGYLLVNNLASQIARENKVLHLEDGLPGSK